MTKAAQERTGKARVSKKKGDALTKAAAVFLTAETIDSVPNIDQVEAVSVLAPAGLDGARALVDALATAPPGSDLARDLASGVLGLIARSSPEARRLLAEKADVAPRAVCHGLAQAGVVALDELEQLLEHDDSEVRDEAGWAIGELGPAASRAVPAILRALARDDNFCPDGLRLTLTSLLGKDAVAS